jgi:hypothetical protein
VSRPRTISGRIAYTSRKPGRVGEERGRESFTMSRHGDGSLTINAHCEIDEPTPTVVRDVIYTLDRDDRPMDCHVRLTVGGAFMGAGLFRMSEGQIACESFGPSIGRVSQVIAVAGAYDGFGTHPIICDAYMTRCMDLSLGPHKRPLRTFLPSMDHRGATPPLTVESRIFIEYVGEADVVTPAGDFHCRQFRFSDEEGGMVGKDGAHPVYDVWVTADDDSLFVQGGVGGYMQTWYELVELRR